MLGFELGSKDFPQPVFYAYSYPTVESFASQKVLPEQAYYSPEMGEFFLNYTVVQKSDDPEKMLHDFLETTYKAAANTLSWNREKLEKK